MSISNVSKWYCVKALVTMILCVILALNISKCFGWLFWHAYHERCLGFKDNLESFLENNSISTTVAWYIQPYALIYYLIIIMGYMAYAIYIYRISSDDKKNIYLNYGSFILLLLILIFNSVLFAGFSQPFIKV